MKPKVKHARLSTLTMTSSFKLLRVALYPLVALAALYAVILTLFTLPALQTEQVWP